MPELLAALAAAALLFAVVTFWQSVRASVGAAPETGTADYEALASARSRSELQEELDATLRTLKDLELERDTDKLGEEDYQMLSGELRAKAKDLLRQREADLGPYLDEARRTVASHLAAEGLAAASSDGQPGPAARSSSTPEGT